MHIRGKNVASLYLLCENLNNTQDRLIIGFVVSIGVKLSCSLAVNVIDRCVSAG